jgi:murein peptide amidase A
MSIFNLNSNEPVYPYKLRRLYWPFLALAEVCREVVGTVVGSFEVDEKRYTIPRFLFRGPATGVPSIRLGIFSLIHGNGSAGALGLQHFLNSLVNDPLSAVGYELAFYPLCNPTGYEDATRFNRAGYDLSREFWRGSSQPEVRIIEEELRTEQFDGIISLHADDASERLGGYTRDRVLNENLLRPALEASSHVLPVSTGHSEEANSETGHRGILAPPPGPQSGPFEVVFRTPVTAPMTQQVEAISCALRSVLKEYRTFIAQGINL